MTSIQKQKPKASVKDSSEKQNFTQLTVRNTTPSEMTLLKSITWSGTQGTPRFPKTIEANGTKGIQHLGDIDLGSKAAVIYVAPNASTVDCAWVIAWDAPANYTPESNKVYVYCDTRAYVQGMSDGLIRMNLDNAWESSDWTAADQKINASASISYSPEILSAVVDASFNLLP